MPDTPPTAPHPFDELPAPTAYVRMLVQGQARQAAALLAGTGLDAATLAQRQDITVAQELTVFRNARRLAGDGGWAVEFGRKLNIASHGPLGFAALSAPTLGDGMAVFGEFARIRAPYLGFATRRDGARLQIELDTGLYPLGDLAEPLVDIVFQIFRAYLDAVLGDSAAHATLRLRRAGGRGAARLAKTYGLRCEFDADVDAVAIPANLAALPCPLHDESAYGAALVRCREALDVLLAMDDLRQRVTNWLAAHFDHAAGDGAPRPLPQLPACARSLAVSPRTLMRRLAAQGTTFRALRDAGQHAAACRLLGDARFTVAEIGARLGYGDAANFGRAFRRLAGVAPGQFRRRRDD